MANFQSDSTQQENKKFENQKSFTQKNPTLKRRLIQVISALIYNADVTHWFNGTISQTGLKKVCVPGLNCYSCPGAISSCPLGALQNTLASGKFPFFITGFFLLIGTLFGRLICSFLCPFGLFQELLFKIPTPKIYHTKKLRPITRKLSHLKYVILAVMCIALPLAFYFKDGFASPFFCKWLCPEGTIFAGWPLVIMNETLRSAIGFLFSWKTILAIAFILWSVFMFRPFCRFFCPLGAIYSFFNKKAVFGIKVDSTKCTHCNACVNSCKMDTLEINDRECIRCGECKSKCHFGAIK
ncbi:MAG: 4Fe-4S binding protein [Spirochaetaceae bacterium]|nr:4Fe-4S binding protein [Spirochaetaceae bacterium]